MLLGEQDAGAKGSMPILLTELLSAGIKCRVSYSICGVKMSRMTGGHFFSQEMTLSLSRNCRVK